MSSAEEAKVIWAKPENETGHLLKKDESKAIEWDQDWRGCID